MKHQIINNDLKKFTIKFNKFLKKKLSKDKNLLNQAILYSINTGGKRFRPYLVYIFGKELNLSNSVIFNLASAIEMLHNYSLVHDDLPSMDDDKFRRGKKTINNKFQNTSISTKGRHDPCVGLRAVPIAEAMMACVLADHILRNRAQCG